MNGFGWRSWISDKWVWVHFRVYSSRRGLRARHVACGGDRLERGTEGYVTHAVNDAGEGWIEVCLAGDCLNHELVSHECLHATLLAYRELRGIHRVTIPHDAAKGDPGEVVDANCIEEQLAYLLGMIVHEFWEWWQKEEA